MSGHTDRRSDLRVLVVGAGIGGLGVARALRARGIAAEVVERESTWAQTGAGIYLPGNALRALRALGLETAVLERAAPIPRQRICDHRGRLLVEIDLAPVWEDVGACVALHRADLHDILRSWGDAVPVRMGRPVGQVRQSGQAVTVEFEDGSVADYDLVIGADGIRSTVRDVLFGNHRAGAAADARAVRSVGQRAWRFVTQCPPAVTTWTVLLGRHTSFLAVPIGNGRVYCYCDTTADTDPHHDGGAISELATVLADFADPVPAILGSVGPQTAVYAGPIEEVVLDGWRRGSVLLIGDAAHATSPNMAEGAAMALEDGLVLAECLAAEPDLTRALTAFETRRHPRTGWVREQTHRRDRTRGLPPIVRDLVLRRWGRKIFHHNYRRLRELP
jgi:2-polyprenyl-6-methoxyphenol hydroxylase-like FAD-dependent oxidoreductase